MAVIARLAYALLFCAILPVLLVLWARGTSAIVSLPAYGNVPIALSLSAAGLLLFVSGIVTLWKRGGGLPMNAFPPPRLVASGVYAVWPHPIYLGFWLICYGVAMTAQSGSGLWLVAPAAALGCAALVYGYEKPHLLRRFGREPLKLLRCLPQPMNDRPAFPEFLRFFLYVQIPWVAIYEIISVLGVQRGSLDTRLAFELRVPVWTWTEAIYASTYLVALFAPLLTPTKRDLRSLTIRSWLAMVTVFPVYLFLPTHAPFRPFVGGGLLGHLLQIERALDMPAEALPSFHVIWAIIAAAAVRSRIAIVWAAAVSFSCVMNGMHSIADVVAGAVWSVGLLRADGVWERLRSSSEAIANSWTEWRLGRFRLINHAFYGGVSSFVCVAIVSALAGNLTVVAYTAAAGLLGAGIWAQCLEGSSRLLRPFGFYGGLLGVAWRRSPRRIPGLCWPRIASPARGFSHSGGCDASCRAAATGARPTSVSASGIVTRARVCAASPVSRDCRSIRRRSTPSLATCLPRWWWPGCGRSALRCRSSAASS